MTIEQPADQWIRLYVAAEIQRSRSNATAVRGAKTGIVPLPFEEATMVADRGRSIATS